MKRRVLVLTDQEFHMPENIKECDNKWLVDWQTEYDVITALAKLGHETQTLGGVTELKELRERLTAWKPHVVFNLLEEFFDESHYVPYLLGYFELIRQPFTGCHSAGLLVADNKPLTKKLLAYHRIAVPRFAFFPQGRSVQRPRRLDFPLIVKSATDHGSEGISQASLVTNDEKMKERVAFIHESLQSDAMAEEYIDGREFYVGVMGNRRLTTLPIWEIPFDNLPEGAPRIATSKIKWDLQYQVKMGIKTGAAKNLPPGVEERMRRLSKRVYRILGLSGYARMDFRLTEDGKIYLLEPNPNPDLARDEDFAESAHEAGIRFRDLIQRILNLGLSYQTGRLEADRQE